MKLRLSMQLYILLALMLLGGVLSVSFSFISAYFLESGLDIGLSQSMRGIAHEVELAESSSAELMGFTVSSDWQSQPELIRTVFSQPQVKGELKKDIDGIPLFGPPKRVVFALLVELDNGELRFVSKAAYPKDKKQERKWLLSPFSLIFLYGLTGIILFALVLLLLLRTVATPVERLREWARSLNESNLSETPPDFRYSELNVLAAIVRSSLSKAQQGLEREHEFLRYASHELRTPIAVTRSNAALLNKMMEKTPASDKQQQVVNRIERASVTMSDLTETLLWLSREEIDDLPATLLDLAEMVEQLTEELNYLLQGKPVALNLQTKPFTCYVPESVCRMILGNLIRNAFQHTQSGDVLIKQQGTQVVISNSLEEGEQPQTSLGFGLGLQLAQRLASRYGWEYAVDARNERHVATITIKSEDVSESQL